MSKILISVLLLMTMGFGGCKTPASETVEEGGGVSNDKATIMIDEKILRQLK